MAQDPAGETGTPDMPAQDRTNLLSDNGSSYVSRLFKACLQLVGIRHKVAAQYHLQTNRERGRYRQAPKPDTRPTGRPIPIRIPALRIS